MTVASDEESRIWAGDTTNIYPPAECSEETPTDEDVALFAALSVSYPDSPILQVDVF